MATPTQVVEEVAQVQPELPQPTVIEGCDHARNYDWNVQVARAVCLAESNGNSNAIGDNFPINGLLAPSCGLMQIRTLEGRPTCEELLDPKVNMDWAYRISNNGTNFKPWSAYTSGAYTKYL